MDEPKMKILSYKVAVVKPLHGGYVVEIHNRGGQDAHDYVERILMDYSNEALEICGNGIVKRFSTIPEALSAGQLAGCVAEEVLHG